MISKRLKTAYMCQRLKKCELNGKKNEHWPIEFFTLLYRSSSDSLRLSLNSRRSSVISLVSTDSDKSLRSIAEDDSSCTDIVSSTRPPPGVTDFDKENWDDPFQVSHYTMDIFNYLKSRESEFEIDNYMERQVHLTKWMRMLLVDWMVEVQETFELNHETLYLAVKIVDIYLGKTLVIRDKLQLLGAAALFLACKYDVSWLFFFAVEGLVWGTIFNFNRLHMTGTNTTAYR